MTVLEIVVVEERRNEFYLQLQGPEGSVPFAGPFETAWGACHALGEALGRACRYGTKTPKGK